MKNFVLVLVLFFLSINLAQADYIDYAKGGNIVTVLSKNADIDAAANETLNDNGGTITFPTNANYISIVSANANDVGGVLATGTITVVDYTDMQNAKASGTYIVKAGSFATLNGIVLTINGTAFTAGSNNTGTTFDVNGESLKTIAANIAARVNANGTVNALVLATSDNNIVSLTAVSNGAASNSLTTTSSDNNGIVASAATLTGGTDLVTLTINGVAFAAGTSFTPATSNTATAASIVTAINANGTVAKKLIATSSAGVITLTALSEGTTANSIGLVTSNANGATVSASTLTGGKADGNGANLVVVKGLDSNYAEKEETVTLNGTSAVLTTNQYLRLNSLEVSEAGSTGSAQGAITATQNGTSLYMGKILADTNQANLGYYTVPAGKDGLLTGLTGSILSGSGVVNIYTQAREEGGVFKDVRIDTLTDNGTNNIPSISTPINFNGKTDIKFTGDADTNNSSVQVRADILILD